jgi:hypothetical protein
MVWMKKKRLFMLLFVLDLVIFSGYFYSKNIYAADPVIRVTAGAFNESGQMTVSLSFHNNPGVASLDLNLEFDNSIITPASYSPGNVFDGVNFSNLQETSVDKTTLTDVKVVWANSTNKTDDGDIATVVFQKKPGAPNQGQSELKLRINTVMNETFQDISVLTENATFSWSGSSNSPGAVHPTSSPTYTWTDLNTSNNTQTTTDSNNGGALEVLPENSSVPLESISLSMQSMVLQKGDTTPLGVTYHPSDTTDSKDVSWESSNTNIAIVNEYGEVTGINEGEVTVTAYVGSKSAGIPVTVVAASVVSAPAEIRENPKTFDFGSLLPILCGLVTVCLIACMYYDRIVSGNFLPRKARKRDR